MAVLTNIYDELIIVLYKEGKRVRDVSEFRLSWYDNDIQRNRVYEGNAEIFSKALKNIKELNPTYDSGYGGQELYGWVRFRDHTWLERNEYDGAEAWEYRCPPSLGPAPVFKKFVKDTCDNKTMVIYDSNLYPTIRETVSEIDGIQIHPENTNAMEGAIYILPIEDYLDNPEKLCDVIYPFYHSLILLVITTDLDYFSNEFMLKKYRLMAHMYEPFVLMPGLLIQTKSVEVRTLFKGRLTKALNNL